MAKTVFYDGPGICLGLRVTVAYKLEIAAGPFVRVRTLEPAANFPQGPARLQEAAGLQEAGL
jgi:hypothetical protein